MVREGVPGGVTVPELLPEGVIDAVQLSDGVMDGDDDPDAPELREGDAEEDEEGCPDTATAVRNSSAVRRTVAI
jgi:hypothetical protein